MGDTKTQLSTHEKKGWLLKWTNYLKGYQKRWFVLSEGCLSYYRAEPTGGPKISTRRKRRAARASENPAEVSHACRGKISLQRALIHTVDACTFVVSGSQTFHIKAATEVERQEWVTALELAKTKAVQAEEEEDYQDNENQEENILTTKDLNESLQKMERCYQVMEKKVEALKHAIIALDMPDLADPSAKAKSFNEKAVSCREAASNMITASKEYLMTAQKQDSKWKKILQHEHDQKLELQSMVVDLANQHRHLEQAAQLAIPSGISHRTSHTVVSTSPSEDDEDSVVFYDAQESDSFTLNISNVNAGNLKSRERDQNDSQGSDDGSSSECDPTPDISANDSTRTESFHIVTDSIALPTSGANASELDNSQSNWQKNNDGNSSGMTRTTSKRKRRTRVPDKPNYPLNLWSIMKNCIGKDLSKIPMPVNFSEPLSMLQRLTEDYEYASILDKAAECTDNFEQLAYIAAFTVSNYSTTASRMGKPFNPLLGETYECDRTEDLGWRAISEQVSHHPPMVAQYCEGRRWRCWQEFTMASKFRGKYLQVVPLGTVHLEFDNSDAHYTWRKVTTTVHNIVVGKLWVDQSGDMEIVNHKNGNKCHIKYIPYSYFSRDSQRKVEGIVMDPNKEGKFVVQGRWDSSIEIAPVLSTSGTPDNPVYKTGRYSVAWSRNYPPEDCEKYYFFTELACQLNEPEDGIAPTDSRFRPDQRLMENGLWDEANAEKLRLEEKQRMVRRAREHEAEKAASQGMPYEPYEPIWFKKQEDPYTNNLCHKYTGEYWDCKRKQDWTRCPQIF